MGVESDQLVYDYLSRVGDLAQTALSADRRMRLVAQLRNDIDRERHGSDSPATVRRILGKLGSPDDVVGAAAGLPRQREDKPQAERTGKAERADVPPQAEAAPTVDEQWWRLAGQQPSLRPIRPGDELTGLPGMTGGVTMPYRPADEEQEREEETAERPSRGRGPGRLGRLGRLRRRPAAKAAEEPVAAARRRPAVLETLAALLLIAGAVLGSGPALVAGWLIAYYSPRLPRREARFAALTLPGLVVGGALVWLWGRFEHRWGEPIAKGELHTAFNDAMPVVVRAAAVATAVFLLWRSRGARR